jgi:hypothetical protein
MTRPRRRFRRAKAASLLGDDAGASVTTGSSTGSGLRSAGRRDPPPEFERFGPPDPDRLRPEPPCPPLRLRLRELLLRPPPLRDPELEPPPEREFPDPPLPPRPDEPEGR